jgi:hypothetical protein
VIRAWRGFWPVPGGEDPQDNGNIEWLLDRRRSPQHIGVIDRILDRLVGEKLVELAEPLARRLHFDASIIA